MFISSFWSFRLIYRNSVSHMVSNYLYLVYQGSSALSPGGREGLEWAKAAVKSLLLK